jgi:hypothetical protein
MGYYKKVRMDEVVRARAVNVPSQPDLVKSKPSGNLLETWLGIVALGGSVRRAKTSQSQVYAASSHEIATSVKLSAGFQQKHRTLTKLFRGIVSKKDVKWQEAHENDGNSVHVETLEDFRRFLVSRRRMAKHSDVGDTYSDVPSERPKLTRYGHRVLGR